MYSEPFQRVEWMYREVPHDLNFFRVMDVTANPFHQKRGCQMNGGSSWKLLPNRFEYSGWWQPGTILMPCQQVIPLVNLGWVKHNVGVKRW
jgi:hypothetical protein